MGNVKANANWIYLLGLLLSFSSKMEASCLINFFPVDQLNLKTSFPVFFWVFFFFFFFVLLKIVFEKINKGESDLVLYKIGHQGVSKSEEKKVASSGK